MSAKNILRAADIYGQHRCLKRSTVGVYLVNDGKFLDRLEAGGSCTLRTAEKVMCWLSDHWPDDLEWPRDVPRPKRRAA